MTTSVHNETDFAMTRADGVTLRGRYLPGAGPLVVFLPGFRSVHSGAKAKAIAATAARHDAACLRMDYAGHGASDGAFEDFRVSEAMRDVTDAVRTVRRPGQPVVLAGPSMGGWFALELVRKGQVDAQGLLLIAPALDFLSRRLAEAPPGLLASLKSRGYMEVPDAYAPGATYRISDRFLADAILHQPPVSPMRLPCPVTIVHGTADEAVPFALSEKLSGHIPGARLVAVPGGDHRLSEHLELITAEMAALLAPP